MTKVTSLSRSIAIAVSSVLLVAFFLSGCAGQNQIQGSAAAAGKGTRNSEPVVLVPEAPGTQTLGNEKATIDVSNVSQGYVTVKYLGSNQKVKFRITFGSNQPYTYDLAQGEDRVFPLTQGSGTYKFGVYEKSNKGEDSYSTAFEGKYDVTLEDEFLPFLYPNQYVNFAPDSAAVAKGAELAASANEDLDVVRNVYEYIIKNITYDYDKADDIKTGKIPSGYLPDVDQTLSEKKGICFDYAALTTAMLRSQKIPTRLVIGMAGELNHAWISVYIDGKGWIDNIIEFKGDEWVLLDPTFAAAGDSAKDFVGDGNNYHELFIY